MQVRLSRPDPPCPMPHAIQCRMRCRAAAVTDTQRQAESSLLPWAAPAVDAGGAMWAWLVLLRQTDRRTANLKGVAEV